MSEEGTTPRVGAGSPAGKRWFVCKYPEWTTTMVPEDVIVSDRGKERKQRPVRIAFTKQVKPWRFQGDGLLGSNNPTGTDRNDNPFWGVYAVDIPTEEDVQKIENKVNKDLPISPNDRKLLLAKEIVDFLRGHEFYRQTHQDNQCESKPLLKELDWDPRTLETGGGVGVFARGREKVSNPAQAPTDGSAVRPSAKIPDLGKNKHQAVA